VHASLATASLKWRSRLEKNGGKEDNVRDRGVWKLIEGNEKKQPLRCLKLFFPPKDVVDGKNCFGN
jgi:hypothetical protein